MIRKSQLADILISDVPKKKHTSDIYTPIEFNFNSKICPFFKQNKYYLCTEDFNNFENNVLYKYIGKTFDNTNTQFPSIFDHDEFVFPSNCQSNITSVDYTFDIDKINEMLLLISTKMIKITTFKNGQLFLLKNVLLERNYFIPSQQTENFNILNLSTIPTDNNNKFFCVAPISNVMYIYLRLYKIIIPIMISTLKPFEPQHAIGN